MIQSSKVGRHRPEPAAPSRPSAGSAARTPGPALPGRRQ